MVVAGEIENEASVKKRKKIVSTKSYAIIIGTNDRYFFVFAFRVKWNGIFPPNLTL